LFLFTAIVCSLPAFAHAEFVSWSLGFEALIPLFLRCFGEIIAWIIGWALTSHGIFGGNITVRYFMERLFYEFT
jgi:hypothetical protein